MIRINVVDDYSGNLEIKTDSIKELVGSVLKNQDCKRGEVKIIFTKDEVIRLFKKKYFNIDVYSDVISFNLEEGEEPLEGEVYISWDRVIENAKIFSQNFETELKRIIIHGSLHLVGYDDKTEDEKFFMGNLEEKYLSLNANLIIL